MNKIKFNEAIERTVGKKAQVTIPKEFRDYFGIKEGDKVYFKLGKYGMEIVSDRLSEEEIRETVKEGQKIAKGEITEGVRIYDDVTQMFTDIEEEIESETYFKSQGDVLFDLSLSNGNMILLTQCQYFALGYLFTTGFLRDLLNHHH